MKIKKMSALTDTGAINSEGMPELSFGPQNLSYYEFWPAWRFYWPIWIYICYLALRYRGVTLLTASNPGFPFGGLVGESKGLILSRAKQILGEMIPPFVVFNRQTDSPKEASSRALKICEEKNIKFPFVAKPDLGCRGAGVQKLHDVQDLENYLLIFPHQQNIIFQELVDLEGEAGIFFVRNPHQSDGQIISITLKYFPYVHGDGKSTLKELIEREPRASKLPGIYLKRFSDQLSSIPAEGERVRLAFAGNHSKGTIFRNGNHLITAQMNNVFNSLFKSIPGFYFGRIDIRFKDFIRIREGHPEFRVIEINGAGSEATHIWDSRTPLLTAWRDVAQQFHLAWQIGAINKKLGTKPASIRDIYRAWRLERSLAKKYPPTL